jgi:DNA polymerase/3'-5' exonuclease PolX
MRAVKLLRQCKHAIKDKESARELAGVGPAMADHVDEFLRTGDVQHWEEGRARLRLGEGKK